MTVMTPPAPVAWWHRYTAFAERVGVLRYIAVILTLTLLVQIVAAVTQHG